MSSLSLAVTGFHRAAQRPDTHNNIVNNNNNNAGAQQNTNESQQQHDNNKLTITLTNEHAHQTPPRSPHGTQQDEVDKPGPDDAAVGAASHAASPLVSDAPPSVFGGRHRTLYHIVVRTDSGFEKTVLQRWSQMRTLRLQALDTYFKSLVPIACLKDFLAEFLHVPIHILAPKEKSNNDPISGLESMNRPDDELALRSFLSTPNEARGNTERASRSAQRAIVDFSKKHRKVFDQLLPVQRSPSSQRTDSVFQSTRYRLSVTSPTSASERASPMAYLNSNFNTVVGIEQHALTVPISRPVWVPPPLSSSMFRSPSNADEPSMLPLDSPGLGALYSDQPPDIKISLDDSSRPNGFGNSPSPSVGVPSRSILRSSEPMSLTLRSGVALSGFKLTPKGWWVARDPKTGHECFYRFGSMGGLSSLARANMGDEIDEPMSPMAQESVYSSLALQQPDKGHHKSMSMGQIHAPPLPRKGTVYKRAVSVTLPDAFDSLVDPNDTIEFAPSAFNVVLPPSSRRPSIDPLPNPTLDASVQPHQQAKASDEDDEDEEMEPPTFHNEE